MLGTNSPPGNSAAPIRFEGRLVNCGEPVRFRVNLSPAEANAAELLIFPRYLENSAKTNARTRAGRLAWLDDLQSVKLDPTQGDLSYTPARPGNYMLRLRTPSAPFYRYFAAVQPEYLVYRMLAYSPVQPPTDAPELRNGGIPIDWTLNSGKLPIMLDPSRGHLALLIDAQRIFGDIVTPFFDTATRAKRHGAATVAPHVDDVLSRMRGAGLEVERAVLDWSGSATSVELYRQRGFDVVDGIIPEIENHRGAPWFPYWMSRGDFLSPAPEPSSQMAMIMDFCAGFHFHGPPDFHMIASECNWGVAGPHADLAAREHVLVARNSRSGPVFVPTLLVFEYMKQGTWPARDWTRGRQLDFVRSFLDDTAFAHARKYPIVFARATDIADYLRAHPSPQPRRILSSITHDWNYDKVWSPEIYNYNYDVHVGVRPFSESLANIRKNRKYIWAKPASRELIYYEDSQSQCRFEYACPKPMLWYDYGDRRPRDAYEGRPELDVPDPRVELNTTITSARFEVRYRLRGGRNFQGYRLALWDIPREFAHGRVETNAREFILVENSDGDYRGILVLDLEPEMELRLALSV